MEKTSDQMRPPGQRFFALDALRGFAAIVVVVYHTGSKQLIPGGYLAVDIFFCLSGFVLAYAYQFSSMNFWQFLRVRLIRLYPLYLVGLLLGAIQVSLSPVNFLLGALFLPGLPTPGAPYRPYSFNIPAWSLFIEMVINIVWYPLRKVSTRLIHGFILAGLALATLLVLVHGTAESGWEGRWFFAEGMARVVFPFFAGVALYRIWGAKSWRLKAPWWAAPILLLFMFVLPGDRRFVDLFVMIILVPLVVALAVNVSAPRLIERIFYFLGDTSYPLYILHSSVIGVLVLLLPDLPMRSYVVAAIAVPASLLLSWSALRWYDHPVRGFLRARLEKRRPSSLLPK